MWSYLRNILGLNPSLELSIGKVTSVKGAFWGNFIQKSHVKKGALVRRGRMSIFKDWKYKCQKGCKFEGAKCIFP